MALLNNGFGYVNVVGPANTGGGMPQGPTYQPSYGDAGQYNPYNTGVINNVPIPVGVPQGQLSNVGITPVSYNTPILGYTPPNSGLPPPSNSNGGIMIGTLPPGNGYAPLPIPDYLKNFVPTDGVVVTLDNNSNVSNNNSNGNSATYGSSGNGPVPVGGGGATVDSNRLGPFPNNSGNGGNNKPPAPPIEIDPKDPKYIPSGTRIYTTFDTNNDIIDKIKEIRTKGLWSDNEGSLGTFFTSSLQTTSQKKYYYEIYQSQSLSCNSAPQFSVAYGHRLGSGSYSGGGQLNDSPSRAIYSQYKLLCLEQNETIFTFKNSVTSDQIYAININRDRIEDKLDPGNFQLSLATLTGNLYSNSAFTGSNVAVTGSSVFTLIDDSGDTDQSVTHLGSYGRVYNLVSGSISDGVHQSDNNSWGLVYPDLGMIILNADVLNVSCSFNSVTSSNVDGDNAYKLFTSISGAAAPTSGRTTTYSFDARNSETVMSTHYFVRVKNSEYNFSNNPTYVSGTLGEFSQPTFVGDPKTYLSSIGLYNDRNELLAVAKLSRPVLKSFTEESLITVKLEY